MPNGWFMLPSSATVVPWTFSPGLSDSMGIVTNGVQVYDASIFVCPAIS